MSKAEEVGENVTRYRWEYSNFLEYVQKGKVDHAVLYAKSLGIDRRTLVHWLSQPELREAMQKAVDDLVDGMKKAGTKDWRMWREYLKMLGIDDETKIDITTNGEKIQAATVIDLGALHATDKPETEPSS
jgi:hypothetical protein